MQLPCKRILPMNELCLTSSTLYPATIKCNDNKYKQKKIQRNLRKDLQDTLCKPQKIIELN